MDMHKQGAVDIESATTTLQAQPDNKTRRYDRQLRLWAASGQAALESSRILVISASATATSILKNLVLPGIGHFTILDPSIVTPADAGNNFFLNGHSSVGKARAQEAVELLRELNDSVEGAADTRSLEEVLSNQQGKDWLKSFSLIITHNLEKDVLSRLSQLLWEAPSNPPLISVRSAGFLAEFYIQFHEHCIIESHSETAPSLRLSRPFPALKEWAETLDYDTLDPTDHSHIPFAVILVKEAQRWKAMRNGSLPTSYEEKQSFKAQINALKRKIDEENFEEAEAQAFRLWSEKPVPTDVAALFELAPLPQDPNQAFHVLLKTLKLFIEKYGAVPLTSSLPDMKTDTASYVRLQNLYKEQAKVENAQFKELLRQSFPDIAIDEATVDAFIKNAHHVKLLRGRQLGAFDQDKEALLNSLQIFPKETLTHLSISALTELLSRETDLSAVTAETLTQEVQSLVGQGIELQPELNDAVGELARAPTADLPNVAAFLGGMVAQEAIKMITKQYVPTNGYCVVDLVDSWTATIGTPQL